MRKTKRLSELHQLALAQFDDSFNATRGDRELARICRRFVNLRGAQWDWDAEGQFENRMKLEIDHVSPSVEKLRNEYRKNSISAKFVPADGTEADILSDAITSRYRADTQDQRGKEARKMAFDCSVEGGFGGMRLRAEYETGDEQRICLEPVNDPEASLYFDANAKLKDKSDATHAFLITPWTRRAFELKYPDEAASWPQDIETKPAYDWFTATNGMDVVRIAEYFIKKDGKETYRILQGLRGEVREFLEDDLEEEMLDELLATGFVEQAPRVDTVDRIVKYVMTGAAILSGPEELPGKHIPLIPQYGVRTVIDYAERFYGRVSKAMDPQIVYNIQVSKVAENAAASGIEKPIFSPEQIAGHEHLWANDHIDNNPFLLANPMRDLQGNPMPGGPLGYTKSPDIPPAVAALISLTRQDVSDQMGNPENGEMLQPDTSGVALDMVQGNLDMNTYGYMDNAADTEMRLAEVYMSMAADIYVEKGRKLRTLSEDGKRGSMELGRMILDDKTGKEVPEIDFSRVPMDVIVEVGPTSSSRRSGIVRTLSSVIGLTADPETQTILTHMMLQNLDGEGIQPLRDYSRKKMVAMGVIKPSKAEEAEMATAAQEPEQPDPQAMLADALAMEAKAKAMLAQANTALAAAKTKESEAKAAETLAGIPLAQQDQALKMAQAIAGDLNAG